MSAENKALIRRWFEEVWNKGREAAIDELLAPAPSSMALVRIYTRMRSSRSIGLIGMHFQT